jgi:pyrroline-5-carboxylate reductase
VKLTKNEKSMRTLFIGGGNMASALAGGLVARGCPLGQLAIVEPLAEQRTRLGERFRGAALFGAPSPDALAGATVIVLAVKPQQMRVACEALAPLLKSSGAIVLSIAAGTRIADIARWLDGFDRIARAMPNTPALIGRGISGIYAPPSIDDAARARVEGVLAAAGETVWVRDESMLDAVTGVSASGPAYVFYFLEALEQAARDLGFDASDARKLAYATFDGAIALARESASEPATLRAQVTSKGGTTERAIASMESDRVKSAIVAAAKAATERARELGDALGRD